MLTIYGKVNNPIYGDMWQILWRGENTLKAMIEFQEVIENAVYPMVKMDWVR